MGKSFRLPDASRHCQLLVMILIATSSNCGNPLKLKIPKIHAKALSGREQNSGMVIIFEMIQWAIRIQAPKDNSMEKVQRLHGDGSLRGLRYSLFPLNIAKARVQKKNYNVLRIMSGIKNPPVPNSKLLIEFQNILGKENSVNSGIVVC